MRAGSKWLSAAVLGAGLAALVLTLAASGSDVAFAYLVPALVLMIPLVAGRYPGERQLARLYRPAAAARSTRPERSMGRRLPIARVLPRGGTLLASAIAVRPPPAGLSFS